MPVGKTASNPPSGTGLGGSARSISEALGGHRNSLGFIRLVLASLVIFDHAFPLGGFGADPVLALTKGQASIGSLAVGGFFAISGYLITKSGMSADLLQYFWRRVLRIFPAFWVVILFTAVIVGPILWVSTGHPIGSYFRFAPDGPFHYLRANWQLSIGAYGIYDQLAASTPWGVQVGASVFNGSLWTLIYEWHAYLLIGVAVAFGVLVNARVLVPLATVLLLALQIAAITNPGSPGAIAPYLADTYRITLTFTFMLGATLAVYSKRVIYSNGLGVLSGLVLLLTLRYGGFLTIGTIAGTYFVFYLAARLPRSVQWIGSKNDYSYGVYIYGFLVQQVLAHLEWYRLGYLPYALIALIVTFGLAWLSWHGVEKRALALKNWGPGRGWSHWIERTRKWRGRRRSIIPTETSGSAAELPASAKP